MRKQAGFLLLATLSACTYGAGDVSPQCTTADQVGYFQAPTSAFWAPYGIAGDHAIVGGDMAFPLYTQEYAGAGLQSATLWPGGTIAYDLPNNLVGQDKVMQAVQAWNALSAQTNVRLVPRTTENNYVAFEDNVPEACFSELGMSGGRQVINLAAGCPVRSYVHEIGHAIGLLHEHQRPDRDQYVTIDLSLMPAEEQEQWRSQFAPVPEIRLLGAYDIRSIMHYRALGGIIKPKDPAIPLDQVGGLTIQTSDVAAVAQLYGGPGPAPITPPQTPQPQPPTQTPQPPGGTTEPPDVGLPPATACYF
jgi:hypothetical protein